MIHYRNIDMVSIVMTINNKKERSMIRSFCNRAIFIFIVKQIKIV